MASDCKSNILHDLVWRGRYIHVDGTLSQDKNFGIDRLGERELGCLSIAGVDFNPFHMSKLVIAGGNGFLGGVLVRHFQKSFDEIVILTRHQKASYENVRYILWDAKTLSNWSDELNNADVLINLTGKNVNCRYTEANKSEILNSRLESTRVLGQATRNTENPPKLWLQASSSTIYNHSHQPNDEGSNNIGDDFSMTVCKEWERAYWEEYCPSTKKIMMRIAIVLGRDGGAMPTLKRLTRFGLGGRQGSGSQMISWIHETDFARSVEWLMHHGKSNGVYNVCSSNAVPNKIFMNSIRHLMNAPIGLPTPEWALSVGAAVIGTETELVLKSRFVHPKNLLSEGFQFEYSNLGLALANLTP